MPTDQRVNIFSIFAKKSLRYLNFMFKKNKNLIAQGIRTDPQGVKQISPNHRLRGYILDPRGAILADQIHPLDGVRIDHSVSSVSGASLI